MMSKKSGFSTLLPPPVQIRPHELDPLSLWPTACRRHEIHISDIHVTLLKQLVQWPSGPKAKIRLLYHCTLFENMLLVTYITVLHWQKVSTFYSVQRRKCGPKTQVSLHEKKTGWCQWALIFCVDVHLLPPRPQASTSAWVEGAGVPNTSDRATELDKIGRIKSSTSSTILAQTTNRGLFTCLYIKSGTWHHMSVTWYLGTTI